MMKANPIFYALRSNLLAPFMVCFFLSFCGSCSNDTEILDEVSEVENPDDVETPENPEGDDTENPCTDTNSYIFNEKDGLVTIEFEASSYDGDWILKTEGTSFSGKGYLEWNGDQHLGTPNLGKISYKIKITNVGVYQFLWNSAVAKGNNGTEHNDSWLRFNDAADFYAQKGTSIVYPKDSGKTPNPEGASKDGWFKIYRSGNDLDFKWQASTFDNNAHNIFVTFEEPGIYTMEVSARSSHHAIDKFVLFKGMSKDDATASTNSASEITCD